MVFCIEPVQPAVLGAEPYASLAVLYDATYDLSLEGVVRRICEVTGKLISLVLPEIHSRIICSSPDIAFVVFVQACYEVCGYGFGGRVVVECLSDVFLVVSSYEKAFGRSDPAFALCSFKKASDFCLGSEYDLAVEGRAVEIEDLAVICKRQHHAVFGICYLFQPVTPGYRRE